MLLSHTAYAMKKKKINKERKSMHPPGFPFKPVGPSEPVSPLSPIKQNRFHICTIQSFTFAFVVTV